MAFCNAASAICCASIAGIKRKASAADCVLEPHAQAYPEREFSNRIKLFTDGSAHKSGRFPTAALTILSLGVDWSGRLSNPSSFTTAEASATTEALRVLIILPPRDAVISYRFGRQALYDESRCPLYLIYLPITQEHCMTSLPKKTRGLCSNGSLAMLGLSEVVVLTASLLTRTAPVESMLTVHLTPLGRSVNSHLFYGNTTQQRL